MLNRKKTKLLIIVSEDWAFLSHRLSLAISAIENNYDVTVVTKLNKHEDEIRNKGINVKNVNFIRSSRFPLTDLINLIRLFNIFKEEKPDIVHNVGLKIIVISSLAGLAFKKTNIVNAFTGLGYVFSSEQLQARIIRACIKPFFQFLALNSRIWTTFQNPDDLDLFKKLKLINPDRNALIRGSGVDIEEFSQSKDQNVIPVVMLASRMLWDKGVGEFVEVAKRINKENIQAKFILVGDVDEANPMSIPRESLKAWSDEGCLSWVGHSNNMPEILKSASIVCLPSYREGLPKVLLEAASIGRPLIATDVPGCREIVKNGHNGILVKLKDIDTLYTAVKELILNNEMRQSMGQNSRKLVEYELSSEIINSQTIKLYKNIYNI